MTTALPTVGFIGLGIMGEPMATRVQAAGYPLVIVDFEPPLPSQLIEAGATVCASNKEVAEQSDVVILMVPDTPDVETVLFAADGVAAGLSRGKSVVDMSSISPAATSTLPDASMPWAATISMPPCRVVRLVLSRVS